MYLSEFIKKLEEIAPPHLAEEFDNGKIGLIVEGTYDVRTVACALDATPHVTEMAAELGVDALVVHHPPFWAPMHGIVGRDADVAKPLMRENINLYAMHTNYDHADGGINDCLADELGLIDRVKGSLEIVGTMTMSFEEIASTLGCSLRVWGDLDDVTRLAVAGGSAFDWELIEEAANLGAQAYLASELKYNIARESPIPCIEATHYALEAPGMRALAKRNDWIFIEDIPETSIIV
ncbi:GTP cyclohydrolase 1 type 2 [Methanocorpusculaceae archaeon Sp1]|uniref:GTP cyclohydrolase 1 type 2 n=1 Tax=Methanorbis furvi TaxID=3028299 RepID=A0AAE4MD89_9EURY|nr:GTP cyclohydrolase 1 type 2 [Methanocorpusculaceae archaeon Sp1]MDV0442256.1 GTP cyclohydrolase 1 type 2 [Methanocorpusculaceae archaeon Ag1]